MIVASNRWVDEISGANTASRALLFYSLAIIALGLYSVISRALFSSDVPARTGLPTVRDEPPAVINLLVNDLSNTADAPTAVLLHLARRGFVSFSISDDGVEYIELTAREAEGTPLAYEAAVLNLVRAAMKTQDEFGPITVETLREFCADRTDNANEWWLSFQEQVAEHAVSLGLVARWCSPTMVRILKACAITVVGVALLSLGRGSTPAQSDPHSWAVGILSISALLTFIALSRLDTDELRYTRSGRNAAADWLQTRSSMQHVGSFADLGPSAVNIWGDAMYRASAVGVARMTSQRLTMVDGDGTEAWYVVNDRWHHTRAFVPRKFGWGVSPWRHLADSALPFLVSTAALSSVGAIVWFGKVKESGGDKVGLQGAIDRVLHFPQRLGVEQLQQALAVSVFAGLLWVLRRHLKRATPLYHAVLDLFMSRREQGVIAFEHDGWIGIGNPHVRTMTLYKLPPELQIDRGGQVELVATRFFGRVKQVRNVEPPRPKRASFS